MIVAYVQLVKKIFEKAYENLVCCIKEEDIDKFNNNYSFITALGENGKSTFIFFKKYNKNTYESYTLELYQK